MGYRKFGMRCLAWALALAMCLPMLPSGAMALDGEWPDDAPGWEQQEDQDLYGGFPVDQAFTDVSDEEYDARDPRTVQIWVAVAVGEDPDSVPEARPGFNNWTVFDRIGYRNEISPEGYDYSHTPSAVLDRDAILGSSRFAQAEDGRHIWGVYWDDGDQDYVRGMTRGIDWDAICRSWADKYGKDADDYGIIPYIVKYQDETIPGEESNKGWHIDCMVVSRIRYTVNYYLDGELDNSAAADGGLLRRTGPVFGDGTYVSVDVPEISGYEYVGGDVDSVYVSKPGENSIDLYYESLPLSYKVKYRTVDGGEIDGVSDSGWAETGKGETEIGWADIEGAYVIGIRGYEFDHAGPDVLTLERGGENAFTAYYRPKLLSYTVRYLEDLEDGGTRDLADPKIVDGQPFGSEAVETAPGFDGYVLAGDASRTLVIDEGENVVEFHYTKVSGLFYTVNYLEQGTDAVLSPAKTVDGKMFGDSVTEEAIAIDGYDAVAPASATIVIGTGENAITFYYARRADLSYTVKYLEQGTDTALSPEKTVGGKKPGDSVTETAVAIDGYDVAGSGSVTAVLIDGSNVITFYYTRRDGLSYTVNYREQGTGTALATVKAVGGKKFGDSVTEHAIAIDGYNPVGDDARTIVISTGVNEITFYYARRTDLSYTVNYLRYGTDAVLASPRIVGGQTFGATVSSADEVIRISGYMFRNADRTTLTIGTGANVINLYYTLNSYPSYPGYPSTPSYPSRPSRPTTSIPDTATPMAPNPLEDIEDADVPKASVPGLNGTDHFAYVVGYGDNLVKPLNDITRAEVATIFFRLMTDEFRQANWATANGFTDVKDSDWFNIAVSTCAGAGVLRGYSDGSFRPNAPITRAEFASMAARFMDGSVTDDGAGDFADTAGHWAAADIRRAAKAGWVQGSGNMFRPNDRITRAEVMTIVNRMLDRLPDAGHMLPDMKKWTDNEEGAWYYEAVQEATNEHDYEMDETNTESWTRIKPDRDWVALESGWKANNGASGK